MPTRSVRWIDRGATWLPVASAVPLLVCLSTPTAHAGPITLDPSTFPVSGIIGQSKPLKVLYDNPGEEIKARIVLPEGDPLQQLNRLATVNLVSGTLTLSPGQRRELVLGSLDFDEFLLFSTRTRSANIQLRNELDGSLLSTIAIQATLRPLFSFNVSDITVTPNVTIGGGTHQPFKAQAGATLDLNFKGQFKSSGPGPDPRMLVSVTGGSVSPELGTFTPATEFPFDFNAGTEDFDFGSLGQFAVSASAAKGTIITQNFSVTFSHPDDNDDIIVVAGNDARVPFNNDTLTKSGSFQVEVPEPGSAALLIVGLAAAARRRIRSALFRAA